MLFIQTDEESRIVAWADFDDNPDADIWAESPWTEVPDDFADYLLVDGQLVYEPRDMPPTPYSAEQVLSALLQETEALDALPDSALAHMAPYMAEWSADSVEYAVGAKVQYSERPYRCLQEHASQETWNPADAPSLWAQILIPDPSVIPEWVQPDSTNPYMAGDRVTHNGKIWESDIDDNVWEPGVYGWTEI